MKTLIGILIGLFVLCLIASCATVIPANGAAMGECEALCRRSLIRCQAYHVRVCAQLACSDLHARCLDAECGVK